MRRESSPTTCSTNFASRSKWVRLFRANRSRSSMTSLKSIFEPQPHREYSFEYTTRFLKTYALPYFSKAKITDVNDAEVVKFFDWRKTNGRRKAPKNTCILHDMSCFKTFLDWAYRRGHINKKIEFDRPKNDGERRPHFDAKDWAKLTRFLREWVKDAKTKSGPIVRDRVMLTNYVLILANTGIRIGEARNLRWRMSILSHPKRKANPTTSFSM